MTMPAQPAPAPAPAVSAQLQAEAALATELVGLYYAIFAKGNARATAPATMQTISGFLGALGL